MVDEGIKCLFRHRIDRIRPDQRFDIQHIAIGGILSSGARPEGTLNLCTRLAKWRESRAFKNLKVLGVGQLRVRNRDLALKSTELTSFFLAYARNLFLDQFVDKCVDPAD